MLIEGVKYLGWKATDKGEAELGGVGTSYLIVWEVQ